MSKFWRHFISNGLSRRIEDRLGLFGHPAALGDVVQRSLALESGHGFIVRLVLPESPAHEAGVLEEDVIVSLASRPVHDAASLHGLLGKLPAEVPLPLAFVRGDRRYERWVLLRDRQRAPAG